VPVPASPPVYAFDDTTLYESDKALVRLLRTLFRPLLKLLFNPNTLNHVLHMQTGINRYMVEFTEHRAARDVLFYEVMHNLVVEVTRASIDVKNMKMRVESIASRLEFNERRARALEAVVQYRPDAERGREHDRERSQPRRSSEPRPQGGPAPEPVQAPGPVDPITGGDSLRSRRKRRRRGRRSGPGFGDETSQMASGASHLASGASDQASGASQIASGASQQASETSHLASESRPEASDPASGGLRPEAIDPASSES